MAVIDVIIVNYKVPLFVEQTIKSVLAASKNIPTAIWVVDNNSNDNSVPYLKARFPEVNYISNTENVGFSKANNQAIRSSSAPFVLLLNPDTIIGENTLVACLEEMNNNTACGAIGIRMHDAEGNYKPECRRGSFSLWNTCCKIIGLSSKFPNCHLFNGYYMGLNEKHKAGKANILCGAFMFMRRQALEKAGLLDERFFMYGEDVDLSYSITKNGYNIRYLPIPMLHYKGESESAAFNPKRYYPAFYGAMLLFYQKHHPNNIFMQAIVKHVVQWKIKQSLKKNYSKEKRPIDTHNLYHYNLNDPFPNLPSGTTIIVEPTPGTYQKLLNLIAHSEGKQYTFITHYPNCSTQGLQPTIPYRSLDEGITLSPGGLVKLL